jgi:ribonuclease HI
MIGAAFQTNGNCGASACIIRDHQGVFRTALALWYDRGLDACTMEAIACRDGLELAKRNGVQRVILETDCLELINLWKDTQRSIVDSLLKEIDVIRLAFQNFSFSYTNRSL